MRIVRILGILFGLLVICLVVAVIGIVLASNSALNKTYDVEAAEVPISDDPEVIARGKYLVETIGVCVECHGEDLGGDEFINDSVLGKVDAPNLTTGEGGVGQTFTTMDYVRAIRHGVDTDGKPLIIMPAQDYNHFTDEDLGAIISYVQSLPPVDRTVDEPSLNGGRLLVLVAKDALLPASQIDHNAEHPASIEMGVTAEYGEYLATVACAGCHGKDYAGQSFPGDSVASANLTPAGNLGNATQEQFFAVLRTGVKINGDIIDTDNMPWVQFSQMSEDDMTAIWMFLQTLEPVESSD